MRSISDTIGRLAAMQLPDMDSFQGTSRLSKLDGDFGTLAAFEYVPETLRGGAPLVVVLHGCSQTAPLYDQGSGWSKLADHHGFALLFPQQQRANNPNGCFNWFSPQHQQRDQGEALSIRQMIAYMLEAHPGLDAKRVFITGLSAGGAMTAVMLAAYPEVFAGGAIIAGLPYGTAQTIPQAFDRMRGYGGPSEPELLADLVRAASPQTDEWPTLSIWQGTADRTVAETNADTLVAQWRSVHGLDAGPSRVEIADGQQRSVWTDENGRDVIECYKIADMGHGTPLNIAEIGSQGPFMLDVGISSTHHIAQFWGIIPRNSKPRPAVKQSEQAAPRLRHIPPALSSAKQEKSGGSTQHGIRVVIEDALRKAGLMQ